MKDSLALTVEEIVGLVDGHEADGFFVYEWDQSTYVFAATSELFDSEPVEPFVIDRNDRGYLRLADFETPDRNYSDFWNSIADLPIVYTVRVDPTAPARISVDIRGEVSEIRK